MKKKLARKRFRIKNDAGKYIGEITAVSLVSKPAIEKEFQLFNEEESLLKINFQISNEDKMEISGPAMIPNQDIIRKDANTGEFYYCYFTEQDILDYSQYFMRYAKKNQANMEHSDEFYKDFFVAESWIVSNPENDKSNALGFKDIPKGTWFLTYKCTNSKLWEEIKNSDLTGFSVEIALEEFKELELEKEIEAIVDNENLSKKEKLEAIKNIIYK